MAVSAARPAGILDVDAGDHLAGGRGGARGDEVDAAGREAAEHALLDDGSHRAAGAADPDAEPFLSRGQPGQDDGAGAAGRHQEAAASGSLDRALGAEEVQADRGRRAGGIGEVQDRGAAEGGVRADQPEIVGRAAGRRRPPSPWRSPSSAV